MNCPATIYYLSINYYYYLYYNYTNCLSTSLIVTPTLLYYDIGGHRKYVMFTSADRLYFGWKNPNQKIGKKNVRFFITGGAVRFIITKIKMPL